VEKRNNVLYNLDWFVVLIYLLLVLFGWVNIYASAYKPEHPSIMDMDMRYGRQMMWIIAATVISIITLIVDAKFYAMFSNFIFGFLILLLVSVLLFGKEVNGARSWFQVGSFGIQPAEFAKLGTSLAIAKLISKPNFRIHKARNLLLIGAILFVPAVLILLQNDTGSALVFSAFILVLYREGLSGVVLLLGAYAILLFVFSLLYSKVAMLIGLIVFCVLLFYILTRRSKETGILSSVLIILIGLLFVLNELFSFGLSIYFLVIIAVGLITPYFVARYLRYKIFKGLLVLGILLGSLSVNYSVDYVFNNILEEHHQRRINDLLGIESDPLGWGYNVNQSKIAIGSGGFHGKGFLNGTQTKFKFVPEQSTDFIFCTVGEEWGFIGTSSVIILFVILLLRLIYLAERQRSAYSRIYIYSVVSIIFFHVVINIGMTIGIIPVIGIPLPFFSYGGSSLWGFTFLLFIALKFDTARKEVVF